LELLRGGSLAGGTFTASGGAFIAFNSGTYAVSGNLAGAGAGEVRLTGATFASASTATFNFTGGGFGMTSGELEGPGEIIFQGIVTLSGSGSKTITGVTVNNTGNWLWIGPGSILGGSAAVFNNSGTFDARTSGGNMSYSGSFFGGGDTTFNNTGSVIKSGDPALTATLALCYNGTAPVGVAVVDSCP
jgi:hypothetical protein